MSGRYYSKQYSRVDDPEAWRSNVALDAYDDPQRLSYPGHTAQPLYDDHRSQTRSSRQPSPDYHQPQSYAAAQSLQPTSYDNHRPLSYASGQSAFDDDDEPLNKDAIRAHNQYLQGPKKHRWTPSAGWRPNTSWWAPREWWTNHRKVTIGVIVAIVLVLIAIIAGIAGGLSSDSFSYTPLYNSVTNEAAFTEGGATRTSPNDTADGIGAGQDKYTYYSGPASNFPDSTAWVSFEDMWNNNEEILKTSCGYLDEGQDNSPEIIQDIYDAIQNRSAVSLVDHRFIFATILQESKGCVRVGKTTSSGGVTNPGLMQSHNGHSYDSSHSSESILAMVQDGTQGTKDGAGLVQNLNTYTNPYSAARGYNSGYIPKSGDLSEAAGATACYVTDIANRLTGWVHAKSTCPGDDQ